MAYRSLVLSVALALLPSGTLRADTMTIGWDELAPAAAEIENPFEGLSDEQLDMLRRILRLESGGDGGGDVDTAVEAEMLRSQLAEQGLDADALFRQRMEIIAQRRLAAENVNVALIGKDVRIPGYLLPLEMRDRKAIEFLLVPTVGACIHTPPPPANQMVHVRYPEGIAIDGLYTPVWIRGRLVEDNTVQTVSYVDGQSRVAVSYAMQPELVEPY